VSCGCRGKAMEEERRRYQAVITEVTGECERLQGALQQRDEDVQAARDSASKWKGRCVR
jgi:hypothetical protein